MFVCLDKIVIAASLGECHCLRSTGSGPLCGGQLSYDDTLLAKLHSPKFLFMAY